MGRDRFVSSNTVKLDLSEGDWITVKERLTYGEQQRIATAGFKTAVADKSRAAAGEYEVSIDFERTNLVRFKTWITAWSFTRDGKPVAVSEAAIAALDAETVAEIDAALTAHIEALAAEKNAMTDGTNSP